MEFVKYDNTSLGIYKTVLEQFPIGSIFITTTNTNPSTFIGGTWESFGTGRTLVGIDTSQTEFNTVLKTGGEKSHTLTQKELPYHGEHLYQYFGAPETEDNGAEGGNYYMDINSTMAQNLFINYKNREYTRFANNEAGIKRHKGNAEDLAHNNLQPYITVYMWKRTK